MTEQEALKYFNNANRTNNMLCILPKSDIGKCIIKALEEIQQYLAIGTPEECRSAVEKQKELKSTNTCGFVAIGKTVEQFEQEIRYKAIDDFSHEIKETFNLEIPLNYPSTKPFFTLENARKLVEDVAEQLKDGSGE